MVNRMTAPPTFVTVVFDPEVALLDIQARSMDRWLDPTAVDRIVILDNCSRPLSSRRIAGLERSYGSVSDRVEVIRTRELIDAPHLHGWRTQQAAKLIVARHIDSPQYVVFDAKNHFIAPTHATSFVSSTGRPHGLSHSYVDHPLRESLERTLRYLGASEPTIVQAIQRFPPTGTPFVFETELVRRMMADIESTAKVPFAEEFESNDLLEFFLYSGWMAERGPGLEEATDGVEVESPTVWPSAANEAGVARAIGKAMSSKSVVFGVHRRALHRADPSTQAAIARFWVDRGLFPDDQAALRYIQRFRRNFVPAMLVARGTERIYDVRRRLEGR